MHPINGHALFRFACDRDDCDCIQADSQIHYCDECQKPFHRTDIEKYCEQIMCDKCYADPTIEKCQPCYPDEEIRAC